MAEWFAIEVKMLEFLSSFPPHPNIVEYRGCRVRKADGLPDYAGKLEPQQ